jgi:hypothetical protein
MFSVEQSDTTILLKIASVVEVVDVVERFLYLP